MLNITYTIYDSVLIELKCFFGELKYKILLYLPVKIEKLSGILVIVVKNITNLIPKVLLNK